MIYIQQLTCSFDNISLILQTEYIQTIFHMIINILLCDTFPGLLPEYITSYTSMFTRLFDSVESGLQYNVYNTMDGELPNVDTVNGLCLITGCNQSAYDDTEWIKNLLNWIKQAYNKGVKICGICFGHQCIAQALGGQVERAAQGWGTGIRKSRVIDSDMRKYFSDGHICLLYNHHDQVVRLPDGAQLAVSSDFCPIESFRIGNQIITFQGHPEYTPEYAVHLLIDFADDESLQVRRNALSSIGSTLHQGQTAARFILDFARK